MKRMKIWIILALNTSLCMKWDIQRSKSHLVQWKMLLEQYDWGCSLSSESFAGFCLHFGKGGLLFKQWWIAMSICKRKGEREHSTYLSNVTLISILKKTLQCFPSQKTAGVKAFAAIALSVTQTGAWHFCNALVPYLQHFFLLNSINFTIQYIQNTRKNIKYW